MWRSLLHVSTLLVTGFAVGQAMDMELYRRVVEMSLQPRGADNAVNEGIKNAIVELVNVHFFLARRVPYTIGSATGLFHTAGRRRKRFSGFGSFGSFGSDWGSSFGFDPWRGSWSNNNRYNNRPSNTHNPYSSGGSSQSSNQHPGNYGGFNTRPQILHCPVQVNQSSVYQLNPTATGYPATEIGNELFIRSLPGSDLFFQCLLRAAVVPGQPPIVAVDQNFVTANHTCPAMNLTLFNYAYQNSLFGGRCWLVQGFQEPVEFNVCMTRSCVNCKLKEQDRSAGYPQFNSNNFHPNNQQSAGRNVTVNQCITEYRTVQVISYCENLPINQRIIYDRIIVPLFCSCKSIDCLRAATHW